MSLVLSMQPGNLELDASLLFGFPAFVCLRSDYTHPNAIATRPVPYVATRNHLRFGCSRQAQSREADSPRVQGL